mgnify:CR=1 FL=1
MNSSATRILSDALVLSPIERAELIDALLGSFDLPEDDAATEQNVPRHPQYACAGALLSAGRDREGELPRGRGRVGLC